jgi:hypothetical protein
MMSMARRSECRRYSWIVSLHGRGDDAVYGIVTVALSSRKSGPEICPAKPWKNGKISN